MSVFAAAMTGKGTGAIATIQVFGDSARAILNNIFKPTGAKPAKFKTGKILLGTINDGSGTIDQVTIGCEGPKTFAINCHGNPLIIEMIMELLQQNGAKLLNPEELLTKIFSVEKSANTIVIEAKLAQLNAKTIQGSKIVASQIDAGLSKKLRDWLEHMNEIPLDKIKAEAVEILQKSQPARLIIYGCTLVLVGPPNTGKSTLLNYMAGRQKAIVTDIKGTTRDWVSATCQIGPLSVNLVDTAGLDNKHLESKDSIEKAAQQKSLEILEQANLILLVLDNSQPAGGLDGWRFEKIKDKKIITVLNKSDLPAKFDTSRLPEILSNTVQISAKFGTGIDSLLEIVRQVCEVADFDLHTPVCITDRQENLLKILKDTKSNQQAASTITELLKGQLSV